LATFLKYQVSAIGGSTISEASQNMIKKLASLDDSFYFFL